VRPGSFRVFVTVARPRPVSRRALLRFPFPLITLLRQIVLAMATQTPAFTRASLQVLRTCADAGCGGPWLDPPLRRAVALNHNAATIRGQFMPTKIVIKPAKSVLAVGPYNHAVRVGDLLFCAGQIPLDPATGQLVTGDIKSQTERVLQNVKAILDDQSLTFANVVKSTVFLTNLADFAGMNEVYAKHFTTDFPARSTIQVAALPKGATVEIEVVAHY
jgi:2-iminobutanoate/2-iminopropanoate deaminase